MSLFLRVLEYSCLGNSEAHNLCKKGSSVIPKESDVATPVTHCLALYIQLVSRAKTGFEWCWLEPLDSFIHILLLSPLWYSLWLRKWVNRKVFPSSLHPRLMSWISTCPPWRWILSFLLSSRTSIKGGFYWSFICVFTISRYLKFCSCSGLLSPMALFLSSSSQYMPFSLWSSEECALPATAQDSGSFILHLLVWLSVGHGYQTVFFFQLNCFVFTLKRSWLELTLWS